MKLESPECWCSVPNIRWRGRNLGGMLPPHLLPDRGLAFWAHSRFLRLQVGLVYMFNLIVGTGALTMPKAFASAGWLVSLVLLVFLGFMR